MTLDEYEHTGKSLYDDFAGVVAAIMDAALRANGSIRVQVIQKRAKASSEVKKKLCGTLTDIETKVKDLAGVRIVVYTNSDMARLNNSGILFENFEIVWERTKIHYPRRDGETEQSQFIGRNYVVRLKDSRVALTEYKRFAGLQCEVQVQTILDHAWSETAHDTIYKSPKLDGIGAAQMAKIKERMRDIQQKYLLRAGYEFQQVLNDFEHIVSGQRLVERDILTSIRDAADNNVRVELLEQYATVVLPIVDDVAAAAPEIRFVLVEAARRAAAMSVMPMDTPIGPMSGRTHVEVLEKIISILSDIRYIEPADAYAAYVELYLMFDASELKQKVVTAVGELARHSLNVWRRYGPAVQEILLDTIAATPQERLASTRPLMIEIAGKCLESEVTGTTSSSTTFTWETGSVSLSDRMRVVRDRALAILKELFKSSQSEVERRRIYSAMQSATRLPTQGRYADTMLERVLADTCAVIGFLSEQADDLDALLKETIEHATLFHYRRAKNMPAETLKYEGVRAARDAVIAAALAQRELFNADSEYVIFKTLVGFESVFCYEWDEDEANVDFAAKDAFRKERAAEYLMLVTDQTADKWFDRLNGYAAIESDDLAMFPQLGAFIADIAQKSSAIATSWIDRSHDQPLLRFRPGILRGFYASDRGAALKWIDAAIDRRDDLSGIAHFIRYAEPAAPDVLDKVASVAIGVEDDGAVYKVLEACAARPDEFGLPLARRLAIDALTFLSARGRYRWTEPLWVWGKRSGLLAQFDDANRTALFAAIRDLPKIDFRAEEILAAFGEPHAGEIIDVFGARLERERAEKGNALVDDRFEAVPHDFSRLHHSMQKSGAVLLPKALDWHRADPLLGRFKSARVVAKMFPELPENVIAQLIAYAQSGDRGAQDFVIDVMSNYDGADVAFTVLKEMVAVLPVDDKLLRDVRAALSETGVMHGEFGYRDAMIAERKRLESWLADEREPVRRFAEAHIRSLENAIAAAQQDAESDIAMRKLEYGEGLDDDTPQANSDQH
jgi:ppGpp synthetase/RelA/SpoT-type nucleotidyltranferase